MIWLRLSFDNVFGSNTSCHSYVIMDICLAHVGHVTLTRMRHHHWIWFRHSGQQVHWWFLIGILQDGENASFRLIIHDLVYAVVDFYLLWVTVFSPKKGGVQSSYWCCVHSTRLPLCRKRVQALHERKLQFEICNHPWVIEDINHSNVKRILQLLLLNIVYNSIDNQIIRLVCPFADTHIVVYCLLLFPSFVELTYWISYALYNQFTLDTRFDGLIKNFGNYFITRYRELGSSLNQTTMVVPLAFDVFRGWTALVLVVLTSGELRWTHVTFAALEILCSNFTWLNTIVYNIHLSLFKVGSKRWLHIQKWTPICMTSHLLL